MMEPSKQLVAKQQQVGKLEAQASEIAAQLVGLKNSIVEKRAALGSLELDNPRAADRTTREIEQLELSVRRKESAQSELARRLVAAQEELQKARAEDGQREFAEIVDNLLRAIPALDADRERHLDAALEIVHWQQRATALREEFGVGVGSLPERAQFNATFDAAGCITGGEARLSFLQRIKEQGELTAAEKEAYGILWDRQYGQQARENQRYLQSDAAKGIDPRALFTLHEWKG